MAYQQSDLDAINAAIAQGTQTVEMPSIGRVVYRSLADMRAIRAEIQQALNCAAGTPTVRRLKVFAIKDL